MKIAMVAALVLALLAPAARGAEPAPAPPLSPDEARRALEVLQDPAQREHAIATLRAIAQAAPAPPQAVAKATGGLGAELVADLSAWLDRAAQEVALIAQAATDLPLLRRWAEQMSADPAARAALLAIAWKLALVLGGAVAIEALLALALARPRRRLAATALVSEPVGASWTRRALRRLPAVFACFLLDLLPIGGFIAGGAILLGVLDSVLGAAPATHGAIVTLLEAYALVRLIMAVTRLLVAPTTPALRLVAIGDEAAAYVEVWTRRIAITAIGGDALAIIAARVNVGENVRDAFLKLVALLVHVFVVIIILQCRAGVAARLRPTPGASGVWAALRNRLAASWHWLAVFLVLAAWFVSAIGLHNGFSRLLQFLLVTLAVLVVSRLASIAVLGLLDRLFHIGPELAGRVPGLEERANRYYPVLRRAVVGALLVITAVALLEAWGIDALAWFRSGAIGGQLVSAMVTIAIAVIAAIAFWEAANAGINRQLARLTGGEQSERAARLRTLLPMLRTVLLIAIFATVGLTALSQIGVNIAPLLAGAGIVGIAVGFGSQKLVQDVITGLFLLLENAMQVGDGVTVAGLSGVVEALSIRSLRLRAGDGSVHIVPFSSVTTVTNANRGLGIVPVNVTVALREDTDRVGAILREIAAGMRQEPEFAPLMLGELELWGIDRLGTAGVTLAGQISCTASGRWTVERALRRRIKLRFQELGIELAIPDATPVVILRPVPT